MEVEPGPTGDSGRADFGGQPDPTGGPKPPGQPHVPGQPGLPGRHGFPGDPEFFDEPDLSASPDFISQQYPAGQPGLPTPIGFALFGRFGYGPTSVTGRPRWRFAALLAGALVIALIVISSTAQSQSSRNPSGPCLGGLAYGPVGTPIGAGNYRFRCVDGGSTVVHRGP
jgi:hypothetical protein